MVESLLSGFGSGRDLRVVGLSPVSGSAGCGACLELSLPLPPPHPPFSLPLWKKKKNAKEDQHSLASVAALQVCLVKAAVSRAASGKSYGCHCIGQQPGWPVNLDSCPQWLPSSAEPLLLKALMRNHTRFHERLRRQEHCGCHLPMPGL